RPMRPRASPRDVEVITAGLGLEAAASAWPRRAVSRDPVTELRFAADESPLRRLRVVPDVVPLTFNEHSHGSVPCGNAAGDSTRRAAHVARASTPRSPGKLESELVSKFKSDNDRATVLRDIEGTAAPRGSIERSAEDTLRDSLVRGGFAARRVLWRCRRRAFAAPRRRLGQRDSS